MSPLIETIGSSSGTGYGFLGQSLPIVSSGLIAWWNSTGYTSGSKTWPATYGGKTLTWNAATGPTKSGSEILANGASGTRWGNAPFSLAEVPTGNPITIELYTTLDYQNMMFGFTSYDVYMSSGIGINTGASDTYGIADTSANFGVLRHWVWVFPTTGSIPSGMRLYINGVQQATSQRAATTGNASPSFFTTGFTFNSWNNDGSYEGSQKIRSIKLYGKELTQAEITKNYNYAVATGIG